MAAARYSIGIVTYLGRFEEFFKPLIRRLYFLFPDYDIMVFINGHFDIAKQVHYLREISTFLCDYPNIRYLTNVEHQPLARGWNYLIMMARNENVLILNDDLSVNLEFRHHLESLSSVAGISTLNGSWSHFIISKATIRRVGWFDERFLAIGYEDGDYICRLAMTGVPLGDVPMQGLDNYAAPPKEATWADISGIICDKYSQINFEFFLKKWFHSHHGPVPEGAFTVSYRGLEWQAALNNSLEAMPEYYPLEVLKNSADLRSLGIIMRGNFARIISLIHALYMDSRRAIGSWLRSIRPRTQAESTSKSD